MGNVKKSLSELELKDNFMFGMVLRDETVCKMFLEEALRQPIARIEFIGKEVSFQDAYLGKGVRLDVYLADAENTRYNIEMQAADVDTLERRIRYYQAQIDRDFLAPGQKYKELPESYIIFVCDFDYFGAGLARYERTVTMGDGEIQRNSDDGSHPIVFNCTYKKQNVSSELACFLDYIHSGKEVDAKGSALAERAHECVLDVKHDKGKEALYLQFQEMMEQQRAEGREEGREEGRVEEAKAAKEAAIARAKALKGQMPDELLAQATGLSLEEVKAL